MKRLMYEFQKSLYPAPSFAVAGGKSRPGPPLVDVVKIDPAAFTVERLASFSLLKFPLNRPETDFRACFLRYMGLFNAPFKRPQEPPAPHPATLRPFVFPVPRPAHLYCNVDSAALWKCL